MGAWGNHCVSYPRKPHTTPYVIHSLYTGTSLFSLFVHYTPGCTGVGPDPTCIPGPRRRYIPPEASGGRRGRGGRRGKGAPRADVPPSATRSCPRVDVPAGRLAAAVRLVPVTSRRRSPLEATGRAAAQRPTALGASHSRLLHRGSRGGIE